MKLRLSCAGLWDPMQPMYPHWFISMCQHGRCHATGDEQSTYRASNEAICG
jgi:hypothetical protein